MKALSLFYPHVEPWCPGVAAPMMNQALRDAAREFCQESNVVQEVVTANTLANESTIEVDLPAQQQFVRVMSTQFKNVWLNVATTGGAPNSVYSPTPGDPTTMWLVDPQLGTITLYPTPTVSETSVLFIRAAFAPTPTATQLADVLYTDWVHAIAAGAIAYLQSNPATGYFSPTSAGFRAKFDVAINKAARITEKGRVVVSQRVQGRAFA
jgi:hypothetical protein